MQLTSTWASSVIVFGVHIFFDCELKMGSRASIRDAGSYSTSPGHLGPVATHFVELLGLVVRVLFS